MMIAVLRSTSLDCFTLPPASLPLSWAATRRRKDGGTLVGQEVAPSNFVFVDNRAFRTNCRRRRRRFRDRKGRDEDFWRKREHRWASIKIYYFVETVYVSSRKLNISWIYMRCARSFIESGKGFNCHIHLCSNVTMKSAMPCPSLSLWPVSKAETAAACYRRGKWPKLYLRGVYDTSDTSHFQMGQMKRQRAMVLRQLERMIVITRETLIGIDYTWIFSTLILAQVEIWCRHWAQSY